MIVHVLYHHVSSWYLHVSSCIIYSIATVKIRCETWAKHPVKRSLGIWYCPPSLHTAKAAHCEEELLLQTRGIEVAVLTSHIAIALECSECLPNKYNCHWWWRNRDLHIACIFIATAWNRDESWVIHTLTAWPADSGTVWTFTTSPIRPQRLPWNGFNHFPKQDALSDLSAYLPKTHDRPKPEKSAPQNASEEGEPFVGFTRSLLFSCWSFK